MLRLMSYPVIYLLFCGVLSPSIAHFSPATEREGPFTTKHGGQKGNEENVVGGPCIQRVAWLLRDGQRWSNRMKHIQYVQSKYPWKKLQKHTETNPKISTLDNFGMFGRCCCHRKEANHMCLNVASLPLRRAIWLDPRRVPLLGILKKWRSPPDNPQNYTSLVRNWFSTINLAGDQFSDQPTWFAHPAQRSHHGQLDRETEAKDQLLLLWLQLI